MTPEVREDSGQAAPLYITAVVGLLVLALIFFAFGEADIQRNGVQSAADAAALAAAKESRSRLEPDLKAHLADPDYFVSMFSPSFPGVPDNACWRASSFAALNKASVVRCQPLADGRWGYEVRLQSNKGMSGDIVPGTAGEKAEAVAVAVIEPRCTFTPESDSTPDPAGSPDTDTDTDADPDPEATATPVGKVRCAGGLDWLVDSEDLTLMPEMADLFSVRLAEN